MAVLEDGSIGLTTEPFWIDARDPDREPLRFTGTFFSVWRRNASGEWKIVLDTPSFSGSPGARQSCQSKGGLPLAAGAAGSTRSGSPGEEETVADGLVRTRDQTANSSAERTLGRSSVVDTR